MSVLDRLLTIETELQARHLERRDVIRGLVLALLSKEHIVLLGPPGADKSGLSRDLTARITAANYFEWQLTRMSTPEELFGPISLRALEQDSYRRVTAGKLPEAHVAYVDETFKASSAILNSMLAVMNERLYYNDGSPMKVPLQVMIGASNELPEDREELGALWDRFLLRFQVAYMRDETSFRAMLTQNRGQGPMATMSLDELREAQDGAMHVDLNPVIPDLLTLRAKMMELGVPVSDRRWHQSLAVVQGQAYLAGRDEAAPGDLITLANVLWSEPQQYPQVRKSIYSLVAPFDSVAEEVLDQATDVYRTALAASEEQQTAAGLEAMKALKVAMKRLEATRDEALKQGQPVDTLTDALKQAQRMNAEVSRVCLKVG